jgi:hypothetical protein
MPSGKIDKCFVQVSELYLEAELGLLRRAVGRSADAIGRFLKVGKH